MSKSSNHIYTHEVFAKQKTYALTNNIRNLGYLLKNLPLQHSSLVVLAILNNLEAFFGEWVSRFCLCLHWSQVVLRGYWPTKPIATHADILCVVF